MLLVRRLPSLILLPVFLALGSGAVAYLHERAHQAEDAAQAQANKDAGLPDQEPPHHDESNCDFHAQLHIPLASVAWVPLLILLGLFVAFLTLISHPLVAKRLPARIDCRGPPVC